MQAQSPSSRDKITEKRRQTEDIEDQRGGRWQALAGQGRGRHGSAKP